MLEKFQFYVDALLTPLVDPTFQHYDFSGFILPIEELADTHSKGGLGKVYRDNPTVFPEILRRKPRQSNAVLLPGLLNAANKSDNPDKQAVCYALAVWRGDRSSFVFTKLHTLLQEGGCNRNLLDVVERLAAVTCNRCGGQSNLIFYKERIPWAWADSRNICQGCKTVLDQPLPDGACKVEVERLLQAKLQDYRQMIREFDAGLQRICTDRTTQAMQLSVATSPAIFPVTRFLSLPASSASQLSAASAVAAEAIAQTPLQRMYATGVSQSILVPPQYHCEIRELIRDTMRFSHRHGTCGGRLTTATASQILRADLLVTQPLIPNNLIASGVAASHVSLQSHRRSRATEGVQLLSKSKAQEYMQTHPRYVNPWTSLEERQIKRKPRSAFEAMASFLYSSPVFEAQPGWLDDLELIENPQQDIFPVPTFKSRTTGDYWIFGWHMTPAFEVSDSSGDTAGIIRNGFKMSFSRTGLYGPGFYLAPEACKSLQYANLFDPDPMRRGTLLLCAGNLGKNPAIITSRRLNETEISLYKNVGRIVLPHRDLRDKEDDRQAHFEFIVVHAPQVILAIKAAPASGEGAMA